MRLALLSQYYPPEVGAPQARLSELAARLKRRGHEVHVLTAMPNYPLGRLYEGYGGLFLRERLDGVSVMRSWIVPTKSVRPAPRLASYLSFAASALAAGALGLPRCDFLMTESPPLLLGPAGWALSRLKGARSIFNVSDLWPESAVRLGAAREGPALSLARRLESFCYRQAWLVTGQSRSILGDIERRFPGTPTCLLSNGVDTSVFRPERRSPEARRALGNGEVVALYAGLHGLAQGLSQVLEAAARLKGRCRLSIVLLGEGPEKEALQARARSLALENVRFLDPLPRERMPPVVAAADIALVPLAAELPGAVPSKLYEAMGAGVPVALCAGGEAADIVRETGCGLVAPPGDGVALAEVLERLAADEGLRRALGRAGRLAAEERYSRDAVVSDFISRLEGAAGGSR